MKLKVVNFKIIVGIFGWFVTYAFLIARTNWLFGLNSSGGGWLELIVNNQFFNFFVEIGLKRKSLKKI